MHKMADMGELGIVRLSSLTQHAAAPNLKRKFCAF